MKQTNIKYWVKARKRGESRKGSAYTKIVHWTKLLDKILPNGTVVKAKWVAV